MILFCFKIFIIKCASLPFVDIPGLGTQKSRFLNLNLFKLIFLIFLILILSSHTYTFAELFFNALYKFKPVIPNPKIKIFLFWKTFEKIIYYLSFKVASPIIAKTIVIIQNRITICDSGHPFFSK